MSLLPERSPSWWRAWVNLANVEGNAQGDEAAWREAHAALAFARAGGQSLEPEDQANLAAAVWDIPLGFENLLKEAAGTKGAGVGVAPLAASIAEGEVQLHDEAGVLRYAAAIDPDDASGKAEVLGLSALDRGDPASAVAPLESEYKAWLAQPQFQFAEGDMPCFLGLAYGLTGRHAEAEAVFKRVATPYSDCYAYHGQALAHAGDVVGAQAVWAEGVRMTPDLPLVYLARGQFETDQGYFRAAEADLSTASVKAPHFADPLKAWGDLFAKEGRWKDALTKYDAALKYAPAWAQLHAAREAAARHA
jgi:tetratricopeptide (TPR) repeat protein